MNTRFTDLVKVIIPIYKAELSELEMRSLKQVYKILKPYPLVVIKPEKLNVSQLISKFPLLTFHSFDNSFFESIAGYNKLMLSETFYSAFLNTRYILIYQLDAYVFRDELTDWCSKGYDYMGAPWLRKPVYNLPVISTLMSLAASYYKKTGKKNKQLLYNKIGNGGFSLRKTESHYLVTKRHNKLIEYFLSQNRNHLYNEDVFWATVPEFTYPGVLEALHFSFDKYPAYCYKLTNHQLPFGCHSWYKRKMKRFWRPIIKF